MAKTSFEKVEQFLDQGLRRLFVEKLRDQADAIKKKKKRTTPIPHPPWEDTEAEEAKKREQQRKIPKLGKAPASVKQLRSLIADLHRVAMFDRRVYVRLGVNQKQLKNFLRKPQAMTADDWHVVNDLREKLDEYKVGVEHDFSKEDEDIVELQRQNQKNARFNVRNDWLPL